MSMIPIILSGLFSVIKAVLPTAADVSKVVLGNKATVANNNFEADKAAQEAFAKEFSYPLGANRTRFDAFMDGVNRFPRPVILIGTMYMLALPIFDPAGATKVYRALELVPAMFWNIAMLIVGFYFTSRLLEKINVQAYRAQPSSRSSFAAESETSERSDPPRARSAPSREEVFAGNSLVNQKRHPPPDELLALAGFGPGELTRTGYTGELPKSRARGWRNPIAQRYSTQEA